tara:strand:- start:7522 stop:7794 length:273 start_codon:yes stop_codon:yes gene_type:complete
MISKTEKKTIVKAVGKPYTTKIFEWLKEKDIQRPDGQLYTKTNISHVLNGIRENILLEGHIVTCAAHFALKLKKDQKKKEAALETIKQAV